MYLPVALFNYEDGGLTARGHSFDKLARAFSVCEEAPALIMLCEAKEYGHKGGTPLHQAADVLSEQLGRNYDARLGWVSRGDIAPAIFFDSQVLALRFWGDQSVGLSRRNVARFRLRGHEDMIQAVVQHWEPNDGGERLLEAKRVNQYGGDPIPTLLGGDLNGTASGSHLPRGEWMEEGYRKRTQKGKQLPDGQWVADTAALDHLVGEWDPALNNGQGGRGESCGFRIVAELAHQTGTPVQEAFMATVNEGIDASGLLIDYLLANGALAPAYARGSYKVHVPPGTTRAEYPSDHRLVVAAFDL
jgi:hypothetical protein